MRPVTEEYFGYETGPIRPPSEAYSLLLRLTRNCPWNKCRFCGLYKGEKFSFRPVEHIKSDIDEIRAWIGYFEKARSGDQTVEKPSNTGSLALNAAGNWFDAGMKSVFLQDANSLVMKPGQIIEVLEYLRKSFPGVDRVTSYARSQTVSRISDADLTAIGRAGLNRIHIGLESGCDEVLRLVRKGADSETHVAAGQKVVKAGIELSEYYMPGLGGIEFSRENAEQTAASAEPHKPGFHQDKDPRRPGQPRDSLRLPGRDPYQDERHRHGRRAASDDKEPRRNHQLPEKTITS